MRKFSKYKKHRLAMFRTMSNQLIEHGQIETTVEKAKDLRPFVEKLITNAKKAHENGKQSLHTRRLLLSKSHNNDKVADILMNELALRFSNRQGGYTRIIRSGIRSGDKGNKAFIQILKED